MSAIVVTGHVWKPSADPRLCDKLEVFTSHDNKESWYLLDISGGKRGDYRVQSATCIPFGTRAMPRNVTGKLPKVIAQWVKDFLRAQSTTPAQSL